MCNMATKKLNPTTKMKLDVYGVISRAVECGVKCGYRRAFKHIEDPSEVAIRDSIETEVMNALSEVIKFDD